jgi:hypothetical protein
MNDLINDLVNESDFELVSYDFDLDQDIVSKYNVDTILPVLIKVDENGNEVKRIKGEHSKKEIIEFIEG